MLIAVSAKGETLDAAVDLRLGRAAGFVLVESDTETFRYLGTGATQVEHGAGIQTAQILVKAGARAVISGDCGPKAFQVLQTAGVPVFSTTGGTVREAIAAWKEKRLPEIQGPGKPHQAPR